MGKLFHAAGHDLLQAVHLLFWIFSSSNKILWKNDIQLHEILCQLSEHILKIY
jgi:hypothetical protein